LAPIPRLRAYSGPAILSYGFRPFFLLGALYAGLAILLWLPAFLGLIRVPTAMAPRDWHVHEMLYGYLPAVATGFLLTAIPNWTGRMPLQGRPLLGLATVWLAGRVAVCLSAMIGSFLAALIDISFLMLVAAICAREVLAGHNWRNLPIIAILVVLIGGNAAFHAEHMLTGTADLGVRIGGFTGADDGHRRPNRPEFRAQLARPRKSGTCANCIRPVRRDRYRRKCGGAGGLGLCAGYRVRRLGAGRWPLLQTLRIGRWAGDRTWREPLVLILHVAYAFVPLGFALAAAASFGVLAASAGIHAWTAGAIGVMTLAVMTRASLGHTGQGLVASPMTQIIYLAAVVSALARVGAALDGSAFMGLLMLSGAAWVMAFLGFAAVYGPLLLRPRRTVSAQRV
jgi:uncharacterized protein involved in response to NO